MSKKKGVFVHKYAQPRMPSRVRRFHAGPKQQEGAEVSVCVVLLVSWHRGGRGQRSPLSDLGTQVRFLDPPSPTDQVTVQPAICRFFVPLQTPDNFENVRSQPCRTRLRLYLQAARGRCRGRYGRWPPLGRCLRGRGVEPQRSPTGTAWRLTVPHQLESKKSQFRANLPPLMLRPLISPSASNLSWGIHPGQRHFSRLSLPTRRSSAPQTWT